MLALLIVPAAAARLLTDRLATILPLSIVLGAGAGWLGLGISYEASVHHGLRLASGATVVLVLVAAYLLALVAGAVRRRRPAGVPA